MTVICPDVAEFQPPLTAAKHLGRFVYQHDVIICRVAFGTGYQDPKLLPNAAAAKQLYHEGHIAGAILYGVQIFKQGDAARHAEYWTGLVGPSAPDWLIGFELDEETWGGASYEQHGDHSGDVNTLGAHLDGYMGHGARTLIYGNTGDLAELCPARTPRPVNVASYGPQLVFHDVPHAIGQQYTNGEITGPPGLPLASAPFGNCDHQVFPGFNDGHALRAFLRPSPGDDMNKAEVDKLIAEALTPLAQRNKVQGERLDRHRQEIHDLRDGYKALEAQVKELAK